MLVLSAANEAAVRDGDTMRVTGEIAQHLLGSRERRLAVDYPVDAPERGDEALERPLLGKVGVRVEERQLVAVVRTSFVAVTKPACVSKSLPKGRFAQGARRARIAHLVIWWFVWAQHRHIDVTRARHTLARVINLLERLAPRKAEARLEERALHNPVSDLREPETVVLTGVSFPGDQAGRQAGTSFPLTWVVYPNT